MEFLRDNYGWIIVLALVIFIFVYKKASGQPDALTSKFETTKRLNTAKEISPLILETLANSNFNKIGFNEEENRFYATTKLSMASWTEHIEVKIDADRLLTFKSICVLPTQVFDWGKNERNWKKFNSELEKLMV